MNLLPLHKDPINCKHKDKCDLKYPESKTCCNGGGPYCGKWRELEGRT